MNVRDLIALLQQQNQEAEVFAVEELCDGITEMNRIGGISPTTSDYYGSAVLLEIED